MRFGLLTIHNIFLFILKKKKKKKKKKEKEKEIQHYRSSYYIIFVFIYL